MIDDFALIEDFMSQQDAAEFYDYIRNNQPVVRPRNDRQNGLYAVRRMSYPGFAPNPEVYRKQSQWENSGGTLNDAPPWYKDLTSRVSLFTGDVYNYASTIAYQKDDWMKPHQHFEDRRRVNQDVVVLSLGPRHPVEISYGATVKFLATIYEKDDDGKIISAKRVVREKFVPNGRTKTILPPHGSIYLLPTRFNQDGSRGEAQHAVLPGDENGLRISINMKSIPPGLNDEDFCEACSRPAGRTNSYSSELFVREPGGPRIYDCHAGRKYPEDAVYVGREVTRGGAGRIGRPRLTATTKN